MEWRPRETERHFTTTLSPDVHSSDRRPDPRDRSCRRRPAELEILREAPTTKSEPIGRSGGPGFWSLLPKPNRPIQRDSHFSLLQSSERFRERLGNRSWGLTVRRGRSDTVGHYSGGERLSITSSSWSDWGSSTRDGNGTSSHRSASSSKSSLCSCTGVSILRIRS